MELAKKTPAKNTCEARPHPPHLRQDRHCQRCTDTDSYPPGPNVGSGSESRQRNAEKRVAHLHVNPLLVQVEPHRVFCARVPRRMASPENLKALPHANDFFCLLRPCLILVQPTCRKGLPMLARYHHYTFPSSLYILRLRVLINANPPIDP